MSDIAQRPSVRPWFRHAAIVVALILTPVLIAAVWDYVETRRLDAAILAIERQGEPTTAVRAETLPATAAEADRYYRAAAVLSSGADTRLSNAMSARLARAERDDMWPPDLVSETRAWLTTRAEAMEFARRAASLPFVAFRTSAEYAYLIGDLAGVLNALAYQAELRALAGDAEGAGDAFYAAARLSGPLGRSFAPTRLATTIRIVSGRVRLSPALLGRVDQALGDADADDAVAQDLVRMRSFVLDGRRQLRGDLTAPWSAHQLNAALSAFAEMIRRARQPWPDRIDAVADVRYAPPSTRSDAVREYTRMLAETPSIRLAGVRALRVAIAVERFRRDHAERLPDRIEQLAPAYLAAVPVDPFSGKAIVLKTDARGYSAYSLGRNRRDDGGDFGDAYAAPTGFPRAPVGGDVGLRVTAGSY